MYHDLFNPKYLTLYWEGLKTPFRSTLGTVILWKLKMQYKDTKLTTVLKPYITSEHFRMSSES